MADTALKFGPEWLRALTESGQGGGGVGGGGGLLTYTPPLPNMKLAEFRYGREEMLALFNKDVKAPEELSQFGSLFVEKSQYPLNLMQMSEEETRTWQRGANSDASLRPYGPPGKRPPSPSGGGLGRGRGRGRGGSVPYYERNRSMDEDLGRDAGGVGLVSSDRGFPRGRSGGGLGGFERQSSDRGWFDRGDRGPGVNGRDEEINGSISPRKGYTRAPFDDWRRGDSVETSQPGAPAGPAGGQSAGQGDSEGWRTSGSSRRWGGAGVGLSQGQGWRSAGDRENNYTRSKFSEGPGVTGRGSGDRWRKDGEEGRGGLSQGRGSVGLARQRSRDDHLPEWATDDPQGEGGFDNDGKFRDNQLRNRQEWGEETNHRWEDEEVDPEDVPGGGQEEKVTNPRSKSTSEDRGSSERGSEDIVLDKNDDLSSSLGSEPPLEVFDKAEEPREVGKEAASLKDHGKQRTTSNGPGDHLETMAGNLVASLVDEDDPHDSVSPPDHGPPLVRPGPDTTPGSSSSAPTPPSGPPSIPPAASEPPVTWSYLDPQHQVQGPFESDEMFEWYSARYFPADLMVRRNIDGRFISLTEMTQLYGRVPFTPGPTPPPTLSAEEERVKQQQLLVQQMLVQQQVQAHIQQQQQQQQQRQQQQQLLALQQQQAGHFQGHLGGLGSLGGIGVPADRGFPSPDPIRSLLGGLGGPNLGGVPGLGGHAGLGGPSLQDHQDPLKALMARNQSAPSMPGLGRPFTNSSPPLSHSSNHHPAVSDQSLFGISTKPDLRLPPVTAPAPPPPVSHGQPPPSKQSPEARQNFDPIQSLLQQLQSGVGSEPASPQLGLRGDPLPPGPSLQQQQQPRPETQSPEQFKQSNYNQRPPVQSIWDLPPQPQEKEEFQPPQPPTSIWNTEPPQEISEPEPPIIEEVSPEPTDDGVDEVEVDLPASQEQEVVSDMNFVKPKSNEKKDKKSKKAEEKRKAKEAKKAAEQSSNTPYIPGMSATKPDEQVVVTSNILDQKEEENRRALIDAAAQQKAQMEALVKLQEEQKLKMEREDLARQQAEKLAKLAPWAKKENSPVKEPGKTGLSLQEIQRLEAERERQERVIREQQEARAREEHRRLEEEERQKRAAKTVNWATVSAGGPEKVKSLAEIQAEEARVEKERADRENAARSVRQNTSSSNLWGGPSKSMSWAGKIAASAPPQPPTRSNGNPWSQTNGTSSSQSSAATVVAPAGFWDPVMPETSNPSSNNNQQNGGNKSNKKNKGKNKKAEEEAKVKQIFSENKPKNDFEEWCTKALQGLQAQVDIPTFLGFLMDIESPFEVHDYVKSYVGEGKAQKKFAVDYLERRSRWKNSLKGGTKYEDDLNIPANALNPGEGEFQFQEAGKKGKKSKTTGKQVKGGKQDMSHLLGFSVSGQGVNRGELDMPQ